MAAVVRVAYQVTTQRAIRDTVVVLAVYSLCVLFATLGVVLPVLFWHKG